MIDQTFLMTYHDHNHIQEEFMYWGTTTIVTQYRFKSDLRCNKPFWHAWIEGREVETVVTGKSEGNAVINLLIDTKHLNLKLVRKYS